MASNQYQAPPPGYPGYPPQQMPPGYPPAPPPKKRFDESKFYRGINILEIVLRIVYGAVKGIKEAGPELMEAANPKQTPEQLIQQFGNQGQG